MKLGECEVCHWLSDAHRNIILVNDSVLILVYRNVAQSWRRKTILDVVSDRLYARVIKLNLLLCILSVNKHRLKVVLAGECHLWLLDVDIALGPHVYK